MTDLSERLAARTEALVAIPSESGNEAAMLEAARAQLPGLLTVVDDQDSVLLALPARRPGAPLILLAGHVDSAARGAGAFYPLKDARSGDTVQLSLEGGGTRSYRVRSVRRVRKDKLPVGVFSRKGGNRLVMVTCGGPFRPGPGTYRDNIIVTAVPR